MNPELSIIIPVYREADAIGPCLTRLSRSDAIRRCEILVVDGDNGSSRTPANIISVRRLSAPSGRGSQLAAGANAARAPRLLFLHVDTALPLDFVCRVIAALAVYPAGAFDLHIETRNPLVKLVSIVGSVRSRLTRIPYGDQAQFIRSDVYRQVGGFPDAPIFEDVALMSQLKANGHRICFVRPPARTSDRRWQAEGALRTTLRNWRLLLAYRAGVSPRTLARRYRPQSEISP